MKPAVLFCTPKWSSRGHGLALPRAEPCPREDGRPPSGWQKPPQRRKLSGQKYRGMPICRHPPGFLSLKKLYYKAKSEPGLNFTTFFAGISKVSPVRGFLPVRAGRSAGANVPKPTSATLSPALTAFAMAAVVAFKALAASAFVKPASAAMALIKSVLFIISVIKWLMNGPVLGLWIFL